jgi:hypothetical protein
MKRLIQVLLIALLAVLPLSCKKAPAPAPEPGAAPGAAAPGAPATASAAVAVKPMPAEIPAVLARVNGEAIERWEFENAVKRIEARGR